MTDIMNREQTLKLVDLALSGVPSMAIDDPHQYAYGVIDGIKMASRAYTNFDLVPGEVLERYDLDLQLMDRSRVLGMLAGTLVVLRSYGEMNVQTSGKEE